MIPLYRVFWVLVLKNLEGHSMHIVSKTEGFFLNSAFIFISCRPSRYLQRIWQTMSEYIWNDE